jgi:hypothetical protein
MLISRLPEDGIQQLLPRQETGMGYQEISLHGSGQPTDVGDYVVINGEFLVPLEEIAHQPLFDSPEIYESVGEISTLNLSQASVVPRFPSSILGPPGTPLPTPLPPFVYATVQGDKFHRLSAFNPDRRIGSNGAVAPGTYATTANDMKVVPSGFAAVGRYALPSRVAACFHYEISPGPGIHILFGTVLPNYGLAGGGVEVYFPSGCPPGSATLKRKPLPKA